MREKTMEIKRSSEENQDLSQGEQIGKNIAPALGKSADTRRSLHDPASQSLPRLRNPFFFEAEEDINTEVKAAPNVRKGLFDQASPMQREAAEIQHARGEVKWYETTIQWDEAKLRTQTQKG